MAATVRLDVATHARVSAAAALAGLSKTTWMERAIAEALQGIVVFDRRAERAVRVTAPDPGDSSRDGGSSDAA